MNTSNGTLFLAELESSDVAPVTGEAALDTPPQDLPDEAATYVRFKAAPHNSAVAYVHGDGSANGWPLDAGRETGLLPVSNLNLYQVSGTSGDVMHYEVIR